jgi:hypothetical protein
MKANEKMLEKFHCEKCDFKCSKKSSWDKHIFTAKHNKANKNIQKYACESCQIIFKHQSSYCRHKKTCVNDIECGNENIGENSNVIDKELIIMLVKQNAELINVIKNTTINQVNNIQSLNNNNSNNKTFNLQVFLNETCKDAMNIMDFVDSIKLQLSDIEKIGEIGYTQGISNIITTNLQALDVTQRPVHCTDKKRETMYVKDKNSWEKEDDNKTKLKKIIKKIEDKNIKLLPVFREKYPDYSNSSSRISDKYDKMVLEVMGGNHTDDIAKEEKIIHNICKSVVIDRN